MWTDEQLGTTMERVNPVPDPETLPDHGDRLWTSLASKRVDRADKRIRPLYRRRAVLVTVALSALIAVPAAASLLDDGPPPLDRDFESVQEPLLTVFGNEQGIPDGCAWRIAFTPTGTPLVGGPCGIFELADGNWDLIATEQAVGLSLMDLAVDGEGGIWVASPDQPLRRLIGDSVVEMEMVSPYVAIDRDGTIWAVDFPYGEGREAHGPPTLVSYSAGSWDHIGGASLDNGASEGVGNPAVGSDGTVWIQVGGELARVSNGGLEVAEFEHPAGWFLDSFELAPDGAVWLVMHSNEVVYRLGVSDVLAYLVRYDGSTSTPLEVPFTEISDLALHADGTIWASSVHGIFSYDGEEWARYSMAEGMPVNEVQSLDIAPDGSVYATTERGVVQIRPNG